MKCLFAGRWTRTVSVGLFQWLIDLSAPSTIPGCFINPKVHIVSFLRYSISPISPARAAQLRTLRVTLREAPSCAFHFAFFLASFLASFLDSVITANRPCQNSALVTGTHPAHPTTSFRRAWSANLAPLHLCFFAFAFPCHNVTPFYLTKVFPFSKSEYQMPVN